MDVLFVPLSAAGHVNPTLPVAREFADRGDLVGYMLPEGFRTDVQRAGARLVPLDERFALSGNGGGMSAGTAPPDEGFFRWMMTKFYARSLPGVPELVERVRSLDPECIVYDPESPWGRVLVEVVEIPAVAFHTTFVATPGPTTERASQPFERRLPLRGLPTFAKLTLTSARLYRRYGVTPPRPAEILPHEAALNVVSLPRSFQPNADHLNDRFVFVGPLIRRKDDDPSVPPLRLDELSGSRLLYISLGTLLRGSQTFRTVCTEAVADTEWKTVLKSGGHDAVDPDPADNVVVRRRVPSQLAVLERADVFVTHGGINSVMEALWYGVPLVVIPQLMDQFLVAERVEKLGLGVRVPATDLTPDTLYDAITTADTECRERVETFQAEIGATAGAERAVDVIKDFIGSKSAPEFCETRSI